MMQFLALGLTCAALVSGLNVQSARQEPLAGKKYAYVTMWVSEKHAPDFVKRSSLKTLAHEQAQFKVIEAEEGLRVPTNLAEKLGGDAVAHMGTLKLAQQLKNLKSEYPIVVLTNEPQLLEIKFNETKQAMYSNVIIKQLGGEDWLKQNCKMHPGNGLHFQKLSIFGLTEYDKLLWIDTDVTPRKNLDSIFDAYDLQDGNTIWGQLDDYMCNGEGDFCSGLMLFKPKEEVFTGLLEKGKAMEVCWGDQRIIRKYFKENPRSLMKFDHKVVQWGHCKWKKNDPMAIHEQRPDNKPFYPR